MRLISIFLIVSFLSLSVTAANKVDYDSYILKIFENEYEVKRDFSSVELSETMKNWLVEVDQILNTNKTNTYDADFKFNIDHLGNIVELELTTIAEYDFDKFKSFVEYLSSIKFPINSFDLTKFNFYLEGATLYLARPRQESTKLEAVISKDLDSKSVSLLEDEFYLVEPKYLDYSFLGQEIILKNSNGVFLKSYVTKKKDSKIYLNTFQIYDDDEVAHLDLDLILTIKNDRKLILKLLQSGLASGIKAGLVNSYSSYGIVPGALALMGMTGTALIEHETDDSLSLEQGEKLQIKIAEENK